MAGRIAPARCRSRTEDTSPLVEVDSLQADAVERDQRFDPPNELGPGGPAVADTQTADAIQEEEHRGLVALELAELPVNLR